MKRRPMSNAPVASTAPGPLSPTVFHILLALAQQQRHGYGIMLEAATLSAGAVRLPPATLYRSLQQLLDQAWIEESDERPDATLDDERRRYYRLTDRGRDALRGESRRLAALVVTAKARRLIPAKDARPRPGAAT